MPSEKADIERQLIGLLLGTAVGDALGLPAEGLSPEKIQRRWKGEWRMSLILGQGMVSDDTEHAFFVGQSLLTAPAHSAEFARGLASRIRWWFLGLPAGVGLATARACLKLCLGFSPERSGVFSAGNGPAMRSALIGAFFAGDGQRRNSYVSASTRITHTDPKAEIAARAVAEAAAWTTGGQLPNPDFFNVLRACGADTEWTRICDQLEGGFGKGHSVGDFARSLGSERGVTGYSFHTVPVATYVWLRHTNDFHKALVESLNCGGDTDTVGAIVGALVGANVGEEGIPPEWLNKISEWPRSLEKLRLLADRDPATAVPRGGLGIWMFNLMQVSFASI